MLTIYFLSQFGEPAIFFPEPAINIEYRNLERSVLEKSFTLLVMKTDLSCKKCVRRISQEDSSSSCTGGNVREQK